MECQTTISPESVDRFARRRIYFPYRLINPSVKYVQDSLSLTFAALADPTRRAILAQLSTGKSTVSEIAEPFALTLPAVTKHLKVLEKAGLITKTKKAQFRNCEINSTGLKEVADWVDEYRTFWEESFDRLGEYLKSVQAENKEEGKINASENEIE